MRVVLAFEVHQPTRIKRDFFWNENMWTHPPTGLKDFYFNRPEDKEIFLRASKKAYRPANEILLSAIDEQKKDPRGLRIAFGISGVFLEQCEEYDPDLLETFKQLASTGRVEFLDETYYHSLASLYDDKEEFNQQVALHKDKLRDLFGVTPTFFENTELIYDDEIASHVASMGYKGIFAEGADRVLEWHSPNYLYVSHGEPRIKVLFRNYRLSDDVAFRFSAKWWTEWPLTAEKYASWLSSLPGQYVGLFMDYETFGEHQWPETGIHDFLRALPGEVLKHNNLSFATPSEVINEEDPVDEISIPKGSTTSWADIERDTSCWLGNAMQWAYFKTIQREGRILRGYNGKEKDVWRYFQLSDIPYYMYTHGGAPGEVHSYFSPYPSPYDAGVTALSAIWDFEEKLRLKLNAADHPFVFTVNGVPTQDVVYTIAGLEDAIKRVPEESIRNHLAKRDISNWLRYELGLNELAKKVDSLSPDVKDVRAELIKILR